MKHKCLKYDCKYYYESDNYGNVCTLTSKHSLVDGCIGLEEIPIKIEKLGCKVSKLLAEINNLNELKETIEGRT